RRGLVADELLEVPLQTLLELPSVEVAGVDAEPRLDGLRDAVAHEDHRRVEVLRRDALGSGNRARELLIEALQRAVQDRAAQHAVDFLVDRAGSQISLDEP